MARRPRLPHEVALRVRDTCMCLHAQRAARALARRFDEAFRPLGVTQGQFSLLMSLHRRSPPTMGQVSALLVMDRTTLTANLKPLERRGLLTVTPDEADRRARRLALTAAGRRVLRAAVPVWKKTHAVIDRLLTQAEEAQLRAALLVLS